MQCIIERVRDSQNLWPINSEFLFPLIISQTNGKSNFLIPHKQDCGEIKRTQSDAVLIAQKVNDWANIINFT